MELNAQEQEGAYRWVGGAGLLALALCFFLVYADNSLSTSKYDQKLGATLKELRTAQTSLPSRVSDERQTQPYTHEKASD